MPDAHTRSKHPLWLDLRELATVDVTSEHPDYPVQRAFDAAASTGWRANRPGSQVIRVRFLRPVRLNHIQISFEERSEARTQEFLLSWCPHGDVRDVSLVRQQFTFAPPDTILEREDYRIELVDVSALVLGIIPHISGGTAIATLQQLRVA